MNDIKVKTTLQKNGDVTLRIKKNQIANWRRIAALFLDAYVDPDDLSRLTEDEKIMLVLDGKLTKAIVKMIKRKDGNINLLPTTLKDQLLGEGRDSIRNS